MNLEKLKQLCDDAVANKDWKTHDITGDGIPETFCNRAAAYIANGMGYMKFTEKMYATKMIGMLQSEPEWEKVSAKVATESALRGVLTFAGKIYDGHSHIAAVYPAPMQTSGSWKRDVPMITNVGQKNGVMRCSGGFPVMFGEPDYYAFTGVQG